jgi:hypothetical protein
MCDRTVVDPEALAAVAHAAAARARDVQTAAQRSDPPLAAVVTELSGARAAAETAELRRAAAAVAVELASALDRLARLLTAASGGYAGAEGHAVRTMTPSGGRR